MRIAILTAQIGHYHEARYRALAATGTEFTVIAVQNEADFAEFLAGSSGTYPVRQLFRGRNAYLRAAANDKVWPAVQAELDGLDPAVIAVAGWATPESFAAIDWARRRQRRLVMLSDSQAHDSARSVWREQIKARVVRLCDSALVAGPSHRHYIVQLGIPLENVFMGYDAVDNDHFALAADAARADDRSMRSQIRVPDRYLLASARFIAKKNLPRMIAAYRKAINGRTTPPDLVILGDGPERAAVEAAIKKGGLKGPVHLLGFRGYADLPALYGLSEGFVHVSTSEQWGLVINEAAAAGVPIVASSACGATPVLLRDGINGFVVEADDTHSIANAVSKLIELPPDRRRQMGAVSRRLVSEWGPKRFASGLRSACEAACRRSTIKATLFDLAALKHLSRRAINSVA